MRQDAVMQQFFALINNVLQESPDTQKRKLRIVTYKVNVVPQKCVCCCRQSSPVNGAEAEQCWQTMQSYMWQITCNSSVMCINVSQTHRQRRTTLHVIHRLKIC